ncbi:hypothetical protein ABNF97_07865 [Plantactinospora sp. B6F1]|uniref:hypothetical protein n=1 Tax=Plantactinospora sp. B6F1 TaxID=3158971 RepID=UPI00102B0917
MTARSPGQWHAVQSRLPHLRATLLASAALLVVATPVGFGVAGVDGGAGVAAGVTLAVVSYLISAYSVAWADSVHPRMIMSVGLVTYAVKMVLLGMVMAAIATTGWSGLLPMGAGIIAGVVVWTATQLVWALRSPLPYAGPSGR